MFDLIPMFLSSIASFLFPLFASYKALKTSDPAQLTPWLMYWSILSCVFLVESWVGFVLVWIPFYSYLRLCFLLYLVLPQTQGARYLYETYLYPYLEENETAIEEFIASAHDRLKATGMAYLKHAIELLRTRVLGLPPAAEVERQEETRATTAPQGYTQALLARFSVPAARWAADNAGSAGHDFYNLLAGAVGAAAAAGAGGGAKSAASSVTAKGDPSASGTLIPDNIGGAQEKITFIAAQKERLSFMLSALDREAQQLNNTEEQASRKDSSPRLEGQQQQQQSSDNGLSRPPSGHSVWSALSKSRSEVDFEKIDAESGAEEDEGTIRRRAQQQQQQQQQQGQQPSEGKAPWSFLGWGVVGTGPSADSGKSSGVDT
ncbi:hypothetical protein MGN70_001603 [Eutypa lata]|nr:hypothetical protein MGN70_001603 [Eutypa lata]